jgi:hypothetical protein
MPSKTLKTFGDRVALDAIDNELWAKVGLTFKNGFAVKQGDVVGVISASKLGRRRSRTTGAGTGFAVDSNTGQVDDASVLAVGDVLKSEDGTVIGTVQSIDLATTPDTVALTGNAAVAVAVGDAVMASDGSEVAKGISDEANDGIDDTPGAIFICGLLDESLLRGLDASAKVELCGSSRVNGIFKF